MLEYQGTPCTAWGTCSVSHPTVHPGRECLFLLVLFQSDAPPARLPLAANIPRHNTHYVAGTSAKSSEGPVPLSVLVNGALRVDFEDLALS